MLPAYRPTPVPGPHTVRVPAPRAPVEPPPGLPSEPRPGHPAWLPPAGVPPHLAGVLDTPPRPGTVTAAGVLWIVLGVLELFWAAAAFGLGTDLPLVVPVLATALGVATVALSAAMLSGVEGARTAVVVLGGCSLAALAPVLLWVPAVILQLHPSSLAWSADAAGRRRALRRP